MNEMPSFFHFTFIFMVWIPAKSLGMTDQRQDVKFFTYATILQH